MKNIRRLYTGYGWFTRKPLVGDRGSVSFKGGQDNVLPNGRNVGERGQYAGDGGGELIGENGPSGDMFGIRNVLGDIVGERGPVGESAIFDLNSELGFTASLHTNVS